MALTTAEAARLAVLVSECVDVIAVVRQLRATGYDSRLRRELTIELGHLKASMRILASNLDVDYVDVEFAREAKQEELRQQALSRT